MFAKATIELELGVEAETGGVKPVQGIPEIPLPKLADIIFPAGTKTRKEIQFAVDLEADTRAKTPIFVFTK